MKFLRNSRGNKSERLAQLLDQGYCIIENALPTRVLNSLNADLDSVFAATPLCQGRFYGERTKRFASLLKRSPSAARLVLSPAILSLVDAVLKPTCDRIQLNVAQAIEIHPGEQSQLPHRDHDMWQGLKGEHEYLVNVMWPLTPFTAENGATRIYPGSHGIEGLSKEDPGTAVSAVCDPGAAICFLGSTLHGAGANLTDLPRRAIVVGYCLGWLKPYENQWLAYPPKVAKGFSPELAALVGYAQHRPNLGNYEGQCPSLLLSENVPEHIGAIDALRPDQEAMMSRADDKASRD
ncbi:phytanoyl-CoA dioxygenase family protein [Novosphingobium sp. P6W]|uniref:phytanoyl-CoA dioxygenase family protein n=1 Tax=Novosphingobium sp. P6W TaxID=1609758 RepID=UPI0005C2EE8F|nr:phytanoyl-CoA dioxygenase family protein [Novosphingobium sp. P6W]AXB76566.1 phytanoyl-CoA dioxygenase family protein [Novosphingobium sp. P6W]KIS30812.1 phytanoyl-CoA dioxygenase [Novosphingobium sp. P6W]